MRKRKKETNDLKSIIANLSPQELRRKKEDFRGDTHKHIDRVNKGAELLAENLMDTVKYHDSSKLDEPELTIYSVLAPLIRQGSYGSEEYETRRQQLGSALAHHYKVNRHHPQHFNDVTYNCELCNATDVNNTGNDICPYCGSKLVPIYHIDKMNLIDVLEMLCDWKAASFRSGGDSKSIYDSIDISIKHFGISPELASILKNTLPLLDTLK